MLASAARSEIIDQSTLTHLVQAGTIRSAHVVGQAGGWGVVVAYGREQRALGVKRGQVRMFRKLDTVSSFLHSIGLDHYQVDSTQFDPGKVQRTNEAARERLQRAHAAAAYEKWFNEEIDLAVKEADDPATQWVSNETVKAESAIRRAAWRQQVKAIS